MRSSSKKWAAGGLVVALLGGYGALDAYDVVPGMLTIDHGNTPRKVEVAGTTYAPLDKVADAPELPAAQEGSAPSAGAVKKSVDASLKNKWLGERTAVVVRDADTGKVLYQHDSSATTTPASVTKLVTGFAVAHSKLAQKQRLTTRAMLSGDRLSLVAGGDMVLARGHGDGSRIAGHAGLADLAEQVAPALKKQGRTKITLDTNTSYAPGPPTAKGWVEGFLTAGFTARISALALDEDRADNRNPAVADPARRAADAFIAALKKQGITATYGKNVTSAPSGATLGSVDSAPVLDLVGLALQDSDNSMTESLARQAAAAEGVHGDSTALGRWVIGKLKSQGIDTRGMKLADTSGLSEGTTLPVRVLGDVLTHGTTGQDPAYQQVISRLPVSAWNGTLHDRYMRPESKDGAGLVRAKSGSLTGVSSLAGTLMTKGDHRLVFAVTTNGQFKQGPLGAKTAIDALVTGLTKLK